MRKTIFIFLLSTVLITAARIFPANKEIQFEHLSIGGLLFAWHQKRQKRIKYLSLRLKTEAEMERTFEKHNISDREKETVCLILKGKTNKEIEDTLYISIKIVKNYVYSIYRKFGVNNRLELIHLIQQSIKVS